ncbi:MAG TPA: DUF3810 family protein [Vicinamibacterales bacterium]|nr:DUF3810 family protein [Vicinamibacterales bacterium]
MVRPAIAVLLVLVAAGILLVPLPPSTVERVYSSLIYPPIQRVVTTASNVVPFALFDVLLIVFPVVWCTLVVRDVRRSARRWRMAARWVWRSVVAAAVFYLLFLVLWGFNYRRVPLERKLDYEPARLTADRARDMTRISVARLNALYASGHARSAAADDRVDPLLAAGFERATRTLGESGATIPARPKPSMLEVYFRPAAVAGMTDPYFLETLIETRLLPVERPFVVAHEWSHLAGFADEGDANFAGWLTCVYADPASQYSGWLFLFGELVNTLPRAQRVELVASLDGGPRGDLRAIAARLARDVRPVVSNAGWRVYDRYLKANRIEAGAASYAQVVRLVLGTRVGFTAGGSVSPPR